MGNASPRVTALFPSMLFLVTQRLKSQTLSTVRASLLGSENVCVLQASVSPLEVGKSCRWVREDRTGISSSKLGKYEGLDCP